MLPLEKNEKVNITTKLRQFCVKAKRNTTSFTTFSIRSTMHVCAAMLLAYLAFFTLTAACERTNVRSWTVLTDDNTQYPTLADKFVKVKGSKNEHSDSLDVPVNVAFDVVADGDDEHGDSNLTEVSVKALYGSLSNFFYLIQVSDSFPTAKRSTETLLIDRHEATGKLVVFLGEVGDPPYASGSEQHTFVGGDLLKNAENPIVVCRNNATRGSPAQQLAEFCATFFDKVKGFTHEELDELQKAMDEFVSNLGREMMSSLQYEDMHSVVRLSSEPMSFVVVSKLLRDYEQLRQRRKEQNKINAEFQEHDEIQNKQLQALATAARNIEEGNDRLAKGIKELEGGIDVLQGKNEALVKGFEAWDTSFEILEDNVEALGKDVEAYCQDVDALGQDLEAFRQGLDALVQDVAALVLSFQARENELEAPGQKIEILEQVVQHDYATGPKPSLVQEAEEEACHSMFFEATALYNVNKYDYVKSIYKLDEV